MTEAGKETGLPDSLRNLPSDGEIAVLEALAVEGESAVARLASGVPVMRLRFLFVDPNRQYILFQSSPDKAANAALLAGPRASLLVEWGEWRIEFSAESPQPAEHRGTVAIRMAFPRSVSIKRRRMQERTHVPPEFPLRCAGYVGGVACFEGTIVDIGEGGIGMFQEYSKKTLEPGVVLAGYCLERPGKEPVRVDLEVRHTETTARADGKPALRIGCRFLHTSPALGALIAEFVRLNR